MIVVGGPAAVIEAGGDAMGATSRSTSHIVLFLVTCGLFSTTAISQPDGDTGNDSLTPKNPIRVESVDATPIVFVEHVGPYWRVGQAFRVISDWMIREGVHAPMFAVYLDDPMQTAAQSLRARVGCFYDGSPEDEGFMSDTVVAHVVAIMTLPERSTPSPIFHHQLAEWVQANHYVPDGQVMEVYLPGDGRRATIEIRMPVKMRGVEAEPAPDIAAEIRTLPEMETVAVDALLAMGAYDRLAMRIVPDARLLDGSLRAWLIDVCDRFRVIRGIALETMGDHAQPIDAMLSPVVERGKSLREALVTAEGSKRSMLSDVQQRRVRSDILRMLDRVMVRVHMKVLAGDKLTDELVEAFREVEVSVYGVGGGLDQMKTAVDNKD